MDLFTSIMLYENVEELSLDNDLGDVGYEGFDMVKWMVRTLPPTKWPHTVTVHSANPIRHEQMVEYMKQFAPRHVLLKSEVAMHV
jgi:hypothetical protein